MPNRNQTHPEDVTSAYLSTLESAKYLSVSPRQLESWRSIGCGPPIIRLGRHVRYSVIDLDEWMNARRVQMTSTEVAQ